MLCNIEEVNQKPECVLTSMLDGMVERMEEELGSKTTVLITGRIAKFIAPLCATPMIYDSNLTLKGLAEIYRRNAQKKE